MMHSIPKVTQDKFFNTFRKIKGRVCSLHGPCNKCGLVLTTSDGKFVCMVDVVEGAMISTFNKHDGYITDFWGEPIQYTVDNNGNATISSTGSGDELTVSIEVNP